MVACCFMTDVPLKLSSVTCNVGQSGMVFIAAFVIILLRSWTFFGKGWKNTVCFINPHSVKSGGVTSGDLGGHAVCTASPNPVT
jgi:hypothetical protein